MLKYKPPEGPASLAERVASVRKYSLANRRLDLMKAHRKEAWDMIDRLSDEELAELLKDTKTCWGAIEVMRKHLLPVVEARTGKVQA